MSAEARLRGVRAFGSVALRSPPWGVAVEVGHAGVAVEAGPWGAAAEVGSCGPDAEVGHAGAAVEVRLREGMAAGARVIGSVALRSPPWG
ncbi:MAG: hypothetical protein ACJ736_06920, partial [Streptomyces sp.]